MIRLWHLNEPGDKWTNVKDSVTGTEFGESGESSVFAEDGLIGGARGTRTSARHGPNVYVAYDSRLDVGTTFSVSAWFRPSELPVDWAWLFGRYEAVSGFPKAWAVKMQDATKYCNPTFHWQGDNTGMSSPTDKQASYSAGEWHKVDMQAEDTTVSIYMDGVLVDTFTRTVDFLTGDGARPFAIGGPVRYTDYGTFPGDFDEVRYGGPIRSADWIKAEYDMLKSPMTFLVAGTLDERDGMAIMIR